jgi:acetylornithine deacetylase/succinyl-diaminopimelate desuccinylase-like protein
MNDFRELLAIPNDANDQEDIAKNVDWCIAALEDRGFDTQVFETPTVPAVLATWSDGYDEDLPIVLFYFHVDGQSVDPQFWYQEDPYIAVLKEEQPGEGWVSISWEKLTYDGFDHDWRVFARSTSDSKGNVMMFLTALDVFLSSQQNWKYNPKVILDFEEEKSSPSLPGVVLEHADDLSADMLVIFDGPRHISGKPTLSFGARGIASLTLTVYGPVFAQHSGHYGNYAPNPALKLSQLLASMKDRKGRVLIEGYYDGISFDDEALQILDDVPDDERVIKAKLGIAKADEVADSYQKALQYPSLNIRGLASGWVGSEARTIVPSQAVAEIDIRLVKESDPERLVSLVKDHIQKQGFFVTDQKPTQTERLTHADICRMNYKISYRAFRTDFSSAVGKWLTAAMSNAFGETPVRHRTSGGSIPISPFVETLGIPAVTVPLANRDNNQHSPNENLRLGNYIDGIKAMYAILTTEIKN